MAEATQAVEEAVAEAGAYLEADHTRGLGVISRWEGSQGD